MLVLSRKKNESIVIGDLITVTVVQIHGDKVRLGVYRPKVMPVFRRESPPSENIESYLNYEGGEASMIAISRKINDALCIANDIMVVIVDIRGDKVRLGIEFPKEVPVHRQEVLEAFKKSEAKEPVDNDDPL